MKIGMGSDAVFVGLGRKRTRPADLCQMRHDDAEQALARRRR